MFEYYNIIKKGLVFTVSTALILTFISELSSNKDELKRVAVELKNVEKSVNKLNNNLVLLLNMDDTEQAYKKIKDLNINKQDFQDLKDSYTESSFTDIDEEIAKIEKQYGTLKIEDIKNIDKEELIKQIEDLSNESLEIKMDD